MSMLAERRKRQKLSVNPSGHIWSSDPSKFGQKLMEKMGWQEGKGLGASEDGNLSHVKVKTNMDSRGLGCTKKDADNWLAHQDEFNALLSQLNQSASRDTSANDCAELPERMTNSLMAKSKSSRKRVHYDKFTKGKDLSLYGEQRLAEIFGLRSAGAVVRQRDDGEDTERCIQQVTVGESRQIVQPCQRDMNMVDSELSMAEYFAKKMAARKQQLGSSAAAPSGAAVAVIANDLCCQGDHPADEGSDGADKGRKRKKRRQEAKADSAEGTSDLALRSEVAQECWEAAVASNTPLTGIHLEEETACREKRQQKRKKAERCHSTDGDQLAADVADDAAVITEGKVQKSQRLKKTEEGKPCSGEPNSVASADASHTDRSPFRKKVKKRHQTSGAEDNGNEVEGDVTRYRRHGVEGQCFGSGGQCGLAHEHCNDNNLHNDVTLYPGDDHMVSEKGGGRKRKKSSGSAAASEGEPHGGSTAKSKVPVSIQVVCSTDALGSSCSHLMPLNGVDVGVDCRPELMVGPKLSSSSSFAAKSEKEAKQESKSRCEPPASQAICEGRTAESSDSVPQSVPGEAVLPRKLNRLISRMRQAGQDAKTKKVTVKTKDEQKDRVQTTSPRAGAPSIGSAHQSRRQKGTLQRNAGHWKVGRAGGMTHAGKHSQGIRGSQVQLFPGSNVRILRGYYAYRVTDADVQWKLSNTAKKWSFSR